MGVWVGPRASQSIYLLSELSQLIKMPVLILEISSICMKAEGPHSEFKGQGDVVFNKHLKYVPDGYTISKHVYSYMEITWNIQSN